MQATYSLDTKIQALNLLDQYDDLRLVTSRLGVPLKTLRGWLADQDNLRQRFENRLYRHLANIKLELLVDMLETSRDFMKKIKSGDHQGIAVSQLAYTLSTLLHHSKQLEENFEELPPDDQTETEQPNRIRFVYEDDLPDAPPRAAENSEEPRPPQRTGVREALRNIGVGTDRHPQSPPPGAQTPPVGRPRRSDDEPNLARSGKRRKTSKRRRHKPKPKAR